MANFSYNSPVNCDVEFDVKNIENKTAIVTGGANGLGEAYVRALVTAGATVVIADLDVDAGNKLEKELIHVKFIKCDTTSWDDQVHLFAAAASFSPTGRISFVVANAGIHRKDEVFAYSGDDKAPQKPDLTTIDVNLIGTLYTSKLASHYFIKQNGQEHSGSQEDTCLILIGSGAAFLDCPRAPQYCSTKWAMRGIMHSLRRTAFYYGSRVNVISPWYVKTNILSEEAFAHITSVGVQFAESSEAGQCLLRILSDKNINGRSFFVSGKKWSTSGYLDLDIEDYQENSLVDSIQRDQVKSAPVELGLFT
ncbi:adam [Penicillium manginii]|uniref:adam n=1 Tax=Penicillium manginii TaxID=203109 RepID=UPI00254972B2|nr:adam [Penicillium manginii]KAJ5755452.1 adam [Penicillium manginii]